MEKKLTAQGPKDRKSYTVTLPIEWVKEEGLDRKKAVELNIVGNKIVISPSSEIEQRVDINGEDYSLNLIKVLQGLYRIGVNEIRLNFVKKELVEKTLDILDKYLIGYEIVEQKKDYILIKEITKESEEDFKVLFRRIFLLLLELSGSDNQIQINALHRNSKKLINYCQRILMKKGHSEFTKIPLYYLVLDRLEKIGDEYSWLLAIQGKNMKILEEINSIFREAYEIFYRFDAKKYTRLQYRTYELKNQIKLGPKVDRATMHLHNLSRLLNSLYADIFALNFNR